MKTTKNSQSQTKSHLLSQEQYDFTQHPYEYVEYGRPNDNPTILLGGIFHNAKSLGVIAEPLVKKGEYIIAFDPPGCGLACELNSSFTFQYMVASIEHFIDKQRFKKVSVMGYSFGTLLAYAFAKFYPARVRKMVLIGAMCLPDPVFAAKIQAAINAAEQGGKKPFAQLTVDYMFSPSKLGKIRNAEQNYQMIRDWISEKYGFYIDKLKNNLYRIQNNQLDYQVMPQVPSHFISAQWDELTPMHHAHHLLQKMNGQNILARHSIIPASSHMMYLENPHLLTEHIANALKTRVNLMEAIA
ncbi:MAG: alpha/beta hydrolase [Bermanella sp.]